MKKQWKKLFVLVCMLAMGMMLGVSASAASKGSVSASSGVSASAASTIKCYLIGNSNVKVYSDSSFTRQCGTVFPSDEITLLSATSSYSWISYPISGGRTKKGYIRNSAIVTAVSGYVYTAKGKVPIMAISLLETVCSFLVPGEIIRKCAIRYRRDTNWRLFELQM